MWAVARRLLDEAVQRGLLKKNPAEGIRGFKASDDESPHRALKREEAKALLDAIDHSTALGKRGYALLMLLLRTGIRRAEVIGLTIGDLGMEQGYHIAVIRHGKGNKRGLATIPVEVRQTINAYLEAVGWAGVAPEAPLFISFRKGDHPQERPLDPNQVERIVKQCAQAVGITMSPYGSGPASLPWLLKVEQISHSSRMRRGIKILERQGGTRNGEITYTRMQLTLCGLNREASSIIFMERFFKCSGPNKEC